ncbi:MAG: NAD(P)-dependent oxidoreductase [Chthoniobacterales bacterium]
MNILVTGGTGQVGSATVDTLLAQGHNVRVVSRHPTDVDNGAEYLVCDTSDYDGVRRAMEGMDAAAHIAAIPRPSAADNQRELILSNSSGSLNIYAAAGDAGVKRVVSASSINALGALFSTTDVPLCYLPVDEEHPSRPSDPYAFSKNVMESLGDYFWLRDGISSATLRIPWVFNRNEGSGNFQRKMSAETDEMVSRMLAKPEAEHREWMRNAMAEWNAWRGARKFESEDTWGQTWSDESPFSPEVKLALNGRYNLWAFIDVLDLADAFARALTADYSGAHTVYVNHDRTWSSHPSRTLAKLFHFDVPEIRGSLEGNDSLVSTAKAKDLFGFRAPHSYLN